MRLDPAAATRHPLSLPELLASRDERQTRQRAWILRHRQALISLTVVAPGAVKDSPLTRQIFNHGASALQALANASGWPICEQKAFDLPSGPEALFALAAPAGQVKQATIALERQHLLGRLWDIDVLTPEGAILSRSHYALPARRCLLCDRPAAVCARGKQHDPGELISRMEVLLNAANAAHRR